MFLHWRGKSCCRLVVFLQKTRRPLLRCTFCFKTANDFCNTIVVLALVNGDGRQALRQAKHRATFCVCIYFRLSLTLGMYPLSSSLLSLCRLLFPPSLPRTPPPLSFFRFRGVSRRVGDLMNKCVYFAEKVYDLLKGQGVPHAENVYASRDGCVDVVS